MDAVVRLRNRKKRHHKREGMVVFASCSHRYWPQSQRCHRARSDSFNL
jgi:hypothetical protein